MKKLTFILFLIVLGFTFVLKAKDWKTEAIDPHVNAKAVLLIEAETGKVLYEKNSKESLPIASMSKLMTQYLVLNAIQNGTLSWESVYEPSDAVQQLMGKAAATKLGMAKGNAYTVKELFTAMTVNSANDAAMALAEMVSGTEEAFADLMNEQARKFKLKETSFYNASGLDGEYIGKGKEQTNHASARDVATIAKKLLEDHPEVLNFTRLTDFTTGDGVRVWSTNLMLPGMPQAFPGIDGLKTGFTEEAGACFVSTGVFEGKRMITVVMDVEANGTDTVNPRFELTRDLIERFVLR